MKELLCTVMCLLVTLARAAYEPPIGIPAPEFGIDETYRMYDDPEVRNEALTYTENVEGGYYTHYIDNTDPDGTDTDNEFGTAAVPRLTLPTRRGYRDYLLAGSVVEIHGGPYHATRSGWDIAAGGTASQPVFIRGYDPLNQTSFVGDVNESTDRFDLVGKYTIYENLSVSNGAYMRIRNWGHDYTPHGLHDPNHISIRSCTWAGAAANSDPYAINATIGASHIVVYNCHIHHYGDSLVNGSTNDKIGVSIAFTANNIWVLDNHIHHNGGDSVQVGNEAGRKVHHVYIGRNEMHDDRENAVDIKEAMDVVVSQNTMYGYHMIGSRADDGAIATVHEGSVVRGTIPKNIWFLYNEMYNAHIGLTMNAVDGLYFVGNYVHDINDNSPGDWPYYGTTFTPFNTYTGSIYYWVNNTIRDVEIGWKTTLNNADTVLVLENNIVDELPYGVDYYHTVFQIDGDGSDSVPVLTNNLFYQSDEKVLLRVNSTTLTVPEYEATNTNATGTIEADPLFDTGYVLGAGSPAIDAGTESSVYDTFYNYWGIDIKKDIDGKQRTGAWDIGAYEFGADPIEPPTDPNEPPVEPPVEPNEPAKKLQIMINMTVEWKLLDREGQSNER